MPPDSYVDWGAVHFYTPLNRTGEQRYLRMKKKVKGCAAVNTAVIPRKKEIGIVPIFVKSVDEKMGDNIGKDKRQEPFGACRHFP